MGNKFKDFRIGDIVKVKECCATHRGLEGKIVELKEERKQIRIQWFDGAGYRNTWFDPEDQYQEIVIKGIDIDIFGVVYRRVTSDLINLKHDNKSLLVSIKNYEVDIGDKLHIIGRKMINNLIIATTVLKGE